MGKWFFEYRFMSFSQKNNIEIQFINHFYSTQICKLFNELENSANKIDKNIHALEKLRSNLFAENLFELFEKDVEKTCLQHSHLNVPSKINNQILKILLIEITNCAEISLFYEIDDLRLITCEDRRYYVSIIILEIVDYFLKNAKPTKIEILLFVIKGKILSQVEIDFERNTSFEFENRFSVGFKNIHSRIKYLGGNFIKTSSKNIRSSICFSIPINKPY